MTKKIITLVLLLGSSLCAAPVLHMHYIGNLGSPGFFIFDIDGVSTLTLCDQFNPGVTTEPYLALGATLADLTGTTLQMAGDPLALQKYQQVGILASLAYADPTIAGDVTWAMRFIVDGQGRLTSKAADLLAWVQTQDPANYSQVLANFVILAPTTAPGFILPTQEQVVIIGGGPNNNAVPEPATMVLMGAGLVGMGFVRRARANAPQQ